MERRVPPVERAVRNCPRLSSFGAKRSLVALPPLAWRRPCLRLAACVGQAQAETVQACTLSNSNGIPVAALLCSFVPCVFRDDPKGCPGRRLQKGGHQWWCLVSSALARPERLSQPRVNCSGEK